MSGFSRRQFLHNSLVAAGAAATAGSVGHLVGAENTSSIANTSPNGKLGIAVCGVNGRGVAHLGAFQGNNALNTEVVVICDADKNIGQKRCAEVAQKQNGREPKFYQDIRQALEDKTVDCVTIAMPNHWHALAAIWSIQAGKDVYVEKPVCHNISEGQRLVETARKHNKICQAGTQGRSNPANIDAKEFIRSGEIGNVNLARGLCYKPRNSIGPKGEYAVPANIDYNLWTGPAPLREKSLYKGSEEHNWAPHYDWHWFWNYGNGDLGNQGVHQLDVARWLLGVDSLANGVITYGGRFGYEDCGETPNTEVVVLDYGPKTLVFEVRGLKTGKLKGAGVGNIIEGSDGYVVMYDGYKSGAAFDKSGEQIATFEGEGNHFANFIDAVRSRRTADLHADIQEGFLSSALCHMGNISYRLGKKISNGEALERLKDVKMSDNAQDTLNRTVKHLARNNVKLDSNIQFQCGPYLKFDPKNETFPGNSQANQMLSREYRAAFEVPSAGHV